MRNLRVASQEGGGRGLGVELREAGQTEAT